MRWQPPPLTAHVRIERLAGPASYCGFCGLEYLVLVAKLAGGLLVACPKCIDKSTIVVDVTPGRRQCLVCRIAGATRHASRVSNEHGIRLCVSKEPGVTSTVKQADFCRACAEAVTRLLRRPDITKGDVDAIDVKVPVAP